MYEEILTSHQEHKRLLEIIKDYYGFDTESDAVNFILSHDDAFNREFIRFLEAI